MTHTALNDEPALGMLLACHQRIRRFSDLAVRLSEARTASPEAVSESAGALERYFSVAFPLHAEDEDLRLPPVLAALKLGDAAQAVLSRLPGEHQRLDALLATLLPTWRELVREPGKLHDAAPALAANAEAFRTLVLAHADAEERDLFPVVAKLVPHHALVELAAAMRERRSGVSLPPAPGMVNIR